MTSKSGRNNPSGVVTVFGGTGFVGRRIVKHLLAKGLDVRAVSRHPLREASGLLGVSGVSGDMRALEKSTDPRARMAIEMFVFRASREIAALVNTLGGLDRLVFTAGIGEHSAAARAAICARLDWLGVTVDQDANTAHAGIISLPDAQVEVRVVPTDEEVTIARHTLNVVRAA